MLRRLRNRVNLDELPPLMGPEEKQRFIQDYLEKQKELARRQRQYKQILSTRLKSRKISIIERSHIEGVEKLSSERNNLRSQIWTASGLEHRRKTRHYLNNIKCHVSCQQRLSKDIAKLKATITNMKKVISRAHKRLYDLNQKTVPENQHQEHVARTNKKAQMLENQLEVGVRRECNITAENATLRQTLVKLLRRRSVFHETYLKLISQLTRDKKYLIDLVEFALSRFENCNSIYDKIEYLHKKVGREKDIRKVEMQDIMRRRTEFKENMGFLYCKSKPRNMEDLQDKEYRRRERFRVKHVNKINLYQKVLDKLMNYADAQHIEDVIEMFQHQESLYYSYFNFENDVSHYLATVNVTINRMYEHISQLKKANESRYEQQQRLNRELFESLEEKRAKNKQLFAASQANDERLANLLKDFEVIYKLCECDPNPLKRMLGDNKRINLKNVHHYLKLLEKRLFDILATVCIGERNDETKTWMTYVVKQIEKVCEWPTDLNDIVLTQQCPECAEGDAFNPDVDESETGAVVQSIAMVKERLKAKVVQPEMQYRLHSLHECRLPRSRVLANKQT